MTEKTKFRKSFGTVQDFVEYTHQNPYDFISYCEILIDEAGGLYLARPSHMEVLIRKACKLLNTSREKLYEKYYQESGLLSPDEWLMSITDLIMVWYEYQKSYNAPNIKQENTLQVLRDNKLIIENLKVLNNLE